MTPEQAAALRKPFAPEAVGKLPRSTKKDNPKGRCNECGGWHGLPAVHLDYVGHAAVTDRLLEVDPLWSWEPLALDDAGLPAVRTSGGMLTLWIRLTVLGVTRIGVGSVEPNGFDVDKQLIGDALRNAAMRFGVALDLWHKGDLESHADGPAPMWGGWASEAEFAETTEAVFEAVRTAPDEVKERAKAWKAERRIEGSRFSKDDFGEFSEFIESLLTQESSARPPTPPAPSAEETGELPDVQTMADDLDRWEKSMTEGQRAALRAWERMVEMPESADEWTDENVTDAWLYVKAQTS